MLQQQEHEQRQQEQQHEREQQQIRNNKMKAFVARKSAGKRRRLPRYHSNSDGERKMKRKMKHKHVGMFGMQMIVDRFGNGWHKMSTQEFAPEPFEPRRIDALFGEAFND